MKSELRFKFGDGLNPQDTPEQTYGCRHTNPDICINCDVAGQCAFATDDNVCRRPSKAWKKQYEKLKMRDE